MGKRNKIYVVFTPIKWRGIYTTWSECQDVLKQCPNGHSFASFKTLQEGQQALKCGTLAAYKDNVGRRKLWMPTCWIGTLAPWMASWAASIMSGSVAR